jgi:hypothetical protein
MPHYRAYHVDDNNRVFGTEVFASPDDQSAIRRADQIINGHDVEVWRRERLVIRLQTNINLRRSKRRNNCPQGSEPNPHPVLGDPCGDEFSPPCPTE